MSVSILGVSINVERNVLFRYLSIVIRSTDFVEDQCGSMYRIHISELCGVLRLDLNYDIY